MTTSLINVLNQDGQTDFSKPHYVVYKDDRDGVRSQTVWKAKSMNDASDHFFQYSFAPLRVKQHSIEFHGKIILLILSYQLDLYFP